MKKKIAILGSTGSIGKALLNIIKKNKNDYEIVLLTANKNYKEIIKQAKLYNVKNIIINNKKSYEKLKKNNIKTKIYNNFDNLKLIFKKKIDYTMNSIVGFSGLDPTLKIIKFTKKIAIANKESIICGWNLIERELKKNNTEIIPVDSEHFSIWSLLNNYKIKNQYQNKKLINEIIITASGGPFLKKPYKELNKITVKDAINHPTWKMGKKISVDSATLANKLFEVIEAQRLFNIKIKDIKIKIHKKSYIHSIINFNNGLIKICAHHPDMRIPIYNTLDIKHSKLTRRDVNYKILNKLDLTDIDTNKFKLIKILKDYPNKCTLFDTALVASNDELVNMFLKKQIKFLDITKKLIMILKMKEIKKLKNIVPKNYNEISDINQFVRLKTFKQSIN